MLDEGNDRKAFELMTTVLVDPSVDAFDPRNPEFEELSDLLMAEVEVRVKKRVKSAGKVEDMGELAIQFGSIDELNGLIERLRG